MAVCVTILSFDKAITMHGSGSRNPPGLEIDARPTATASVVVSEGSGDAVEELSPYLPGEVIADRYRLVRELGRGGMGVVWVAHAISLEVDVAVKLIHVSVAGQAVAARMAREAHAAARLGHPALVRVFDFGWTNRADPFLVMELVQGETLSAVLERDTRIQAIRAVQMLLPIADGLRLAHEHSIIHRDIKPDNILIAADALGRIQPKLLDFGIAKVELSKTDLRLTQVGVALGSPEYMSPEQAQGIEDIDARTDVWSLAVVLYEMTTGDIPFAQENYNALLQSIIHDPPAPLPVDAALDPVLLEIIQRGLRKDREQRWSSISEFGESLALWLYEHGTKEDISGNSIRAVWLDGAVSGVSHDVATTPSEPMLPLSIKINQPPKRPNLPTMEAVAQKRRDLVRTEKQRGTRTIAVAVGAIGILLSGLVVGSLWHDAEPSVAITAIPYVGMNRGWPKSAEEAVSRAMRNLRISSRNASYFTPDSTDVPLAEALPVVATPGSKSPPPARATAKPMRHSTKPPRDFGF